jgi:hypothetical protein
LNEEIRARLGDSAPEITSSVEQQPKTNPNIIDGLYVFKIGKVIIFKNKRIADFINGEYLIQKIIRE